MAIGGAIAASAGAAFLCYVNPFALSPGSNINPKQYATVGVFDCEGECIIGLSVGGRLDKRLPDGQPQFGD